MDKERDSESSYGAPLRRKKRIPKQLPVDQRQELRNADLAEWKENYIANMAEAVSSQAHRKTAANAKKNAAHWVIGLGIAGVGAGIGAQKLKSPLQVFSGLPFLEALRGIPASTGRKRPRGDDNEYGADNEGRNVRSRDDDGDRFGRGGDNILQDDDAGLVLADDVGQPNIQNFAFTYTLVGHRSRPSCSTSPRRPLDALECQRLLQTRLPCTRSWLPIKHRWFPHQRWRCIRLHRRSTSHFTRSTCQPNNQRQSPSQPGPAALQ